MNAERAEPQDWAISSQLTCKSKLRLCPSLVFFLYSQKTQTLQSKNSNMVVGLYSASHRDALITHWDLLALT